MWCKNLASSAPNFGLPLNPSCSSSSTAVLYRCGPLLGLSPDASRWLTNSYFLRGAGASVAVVAPFPATLPFVPAPTAPTPAVGGVAVPDSFIPDPGANANLASAGISEFACPNEARYSCPLIVRKASSLCSSGHQQESLVFLFAHSSLTDAHSSSLPSTQLGRYHRQRGKGCERS